MAKSSQKKEKEEDESLKRYIKLYEMEQVMNITPPKKKRPKIAS